MDLNKFSDEDLIKAYLDGDEIAFEKLVKRYLPLMYGFVRRYTGNPNNASDISQEIFIKVWKNIKKFDQGKKFKTWIFAIAENTCIDWLRKKTEIPFSVLEKDAGENGLMDILTAKLDRLDDPYEKKLLFGNLSSEHKRIITLHDVDKFTFKEIAEMMKKPLNTVKSTYRRGILAIRKKGNAPK